jgi:hypothetical protein
MACGNDGCARTGSIQICVVQLLLGLVGVTLTSPGWASDPAFEPFRWNEDYRYLSAKSTVSAYERLKYRPLNVGDQDGHLSFGGSVRSRANLFDNDRFGLQGGSDGAVWLQRFYGHADIHVGERFRVFVELSSHLADGSNQLQPGPFDRDDAALSQAFVDWRFGGSRLRLGRQEVGLGSARLMSARDGPNVRLSYDGLRLDHTFGDTQLLGFYLREVEVRQGVFDNSSRSDDSIWGVNGTWAPGRGHVDVYYLGLKRKDSVYVQGEEDEIRHSVGTRLFGSVGGWDWNLEALYQFGNFGDSDIRAWTMASIVGYRFANVRWQPRLALSANVASGDDDADDRRLGTFNPINPNLNYFEEAAILAPQNFFNIEPEISWVITPRLGMALDWNFFWRLEENDAVYVRGLNPLPGTADVKGHRVAHTPSISIDYQWSRQIKLDLSYSHFFARTVIRNAHGKDISFLKLQMQWTF